MKNNVVKLTANGAGEVMQERLEHFIKHGRTLEDDLKYNHDMQLLHGARWLLSISLPQMMAPRGWDQVLWSKMRKKP